MDKLKSKVAIVLSAVFIVSAVLGMAPDTRADAASYSVSNPTVNQSHVVTWDCIYFGNYWQEDTNGDQKADKNDAKKPIKWRVLSVSGDDAFIMAEKCLDYQKYNEENAKVTWETCTLREWLNGTFYNNAFSPAEQAAIRTTTVIHDDSKNGTSGGKDTQDKVYLPSLKEVTTAKYGFDMNSKSESETRFSYPTEYVAKNPDHLLDASLTDPFMWWTRTPGNDNLYVKGISGGAEGSTDIQGGGIRCIWECGVRPVLHINLSVSSVWKKAGTVQQKSMLTATKNVSTTKTSSATKVKVPKVKYKLKANRLTVKYTAPKNAAGFQVRYKLGKGKWKKRTFNISRSISKTIGGLKKGKYTVQVRSFTEGRKIFSKWSKAKKIKVKKAAKKTAKKTTKKPKLNLDEK